METLALLVGLYLCWTWLLRPLHDFYVDKQNAAFNRAYRHFQLKTVQDRYSYCERMTLNEIADRYDFEEAYHRIGSR